MSKSLVEDDLMKLPPNWNEASSLASIAISMKRIADALDGTNHAKQVSEFMESFLRK